MEVKKQVLVLEFECVTGKAMKVTILRPKSGITPTIIKSVAANMIKENVVANEEGGLIAKLDKAYYSTMAVEEIAM